MSTVLHTIWAVVKVFCFILGAASLAIAIAVAIAVLRDERSNRLDAELRRLLDEETR